MLCENGQIGRMEAGLVLTIIHQHLSEHLFSMLVMMWCAQLKKF